MLSYEKKAVNLQSVADRVGLAPCSVSAVLNDTPAAKAIPQATKDRVFRAAKELKYRPNLWARSLRTKRTKMVAAVTPDFGRGRVAQVVAGLQNRLQQRGYLLALTGLDLGDGDHLSAQFRQRGIEGVIAIDAGLPGEFELPVATVDLGYIGSSEPMAQDMREWLITIGETAAETIIHQIETHGASPRLPVEPKLPPSYFDVSRVQTSVEVRESA
jgi:hypothetical protein